jgi:hypothetical protein
MVKSKVIPHGQVVLVDKQTVPEYKVVSQTVLENKTKQKREMSELQKANIERLVALNKQRALERRGIQTIPQDKNPSEIEIPDGKELVYIKPKKQSKVSNKLSNDSNDSNDSNELPNESPKLMRQNGYYVNTQAPPVYMLAYPPPPPPPRPTKPSRPKSKKQPVSYYEETSEDEEKTETETETDTDTEINRYSKKVQKRTSVLSKIEEELNQLKNKMNQPKVNNPYSKHSIF